MSQCSVLQFAVGETSTIIPLPQLYLQGDGAQFSVFQVANVVEATFDGK